MARNSSGDAQNSSQCRQLDKLAEDPDFRSLHGWLREFNMFDAVGIERQELQHSNFLAFLLDPKRDHGLEGRFTEILLNEIKNSSKGKEPLATFWITPGGFNDAVVQREWLHIDILLRCPNIEVVFIIENKIDSPERDNQLEKYLETVRNEYPKLKPFGIYLTPNAEKPSRSEYTPVGYQLIGDSVERLLKEHADRMPNDVEMVVRHYNDMIKRKLNAMEPKVKRKCWDIYYKHRHAFDLIRECMDESDPIREYLKELIDQSRILKSYGDRKGYVEFQPMKWKGRNFVGSKRLLEDLLFFEFQYGDAQRAKGALVLLLAINTADNGKRDPKRAFDLAKQNGRPFIVQSSFRNWPTIFHEEFMSQQDMGNLDLSLEMKKKIERQWNDFLSKTLPSLNKAIQKHFAP